MKGCSFIFTRVDLYPGQSLVNDPATTLHGWEQPPEFANPKDALDYMVGLIMQPDTVKINCTALPMVQQLRHCNGYAICKSLQRVNLIPDVLTFISRSLLCMLLWQLVKKPILNITLKIATT